MDAKALIPARICAECSTSFNPRSARQRYCKYTCRAKANYHRKKKPSDRSWAKRQCCICNKDYHAGSFTSKYCSNRCRKLAVQWQRDKEKGINEKRGNLFQEVAALCDFCSKEYYPKNNTQRFCNENCKFAYRAAKKRREGPTFELKPCQICSKEFRPKSPQNIYCSKKCLTVANGRRHLTKRIWLCSQCGNSFTAWGSRKRVYCSNQCRDSGEQLRGKEKTRAKIRKRKELFDKGIETMVLPHIQGAASVAIVPNHCKITKKENLDSPSGFTKEIENFLSKGGKIKKLELEVAKDSTQKVSTGGTSYGLDDNDSSATLSDLSVF